MTPARTAIVGTGRVAQAFGRLLADAGSAPVARNWLATPTPTGTGS